MLALRAAAPSALRAALSTRTFVSGPPGGAGRGPAPIPLADRAAQREIDASIARAEAGEHVELHPDAEKEPLPAHPDGVNPVTGERGGPRGPEPTRYGDWERKAYF
ncbi:hypothetical protein, variant [Allomyces macrogynus ATCC 38327]|uniref:Succinate dehydrogenase assembly factor 4, mitochondrial n=1 Tax=Allomyces macrogynus (strain ATCC 38327) TaxID=578462 RepID=A0A0L0SPG7_ALLM3|nr:hypothetical protein, variant [Allomyces macrogynus ATCC 38327]|eukprot:KNE64377.1 hypothetical protein, variant [Allomyces macrogynus ATCC 38327]